MVFNILTHPVCRFRYVNANFVRGYGSSTVTKALLISSAFLTECSHACVVLRRGPSLPAPKAIEQYHVYTPLLSFTTKISFFSP